MKLRMITMLIPLMAAVSCGTLGQVSTNQQYTDGFYYTAPAQSDIEQKDSDNRLDNLASRTRGSRIYLKGGKVDTLFIPEKMQASVTVRDSLTVIDLYDSTPDWRDYDWNYWNYGWTFGTYYSLFSPWAFRPCYGFGWYDPWYYRYDPFYYGWYDPWYYPGFHHYYGWYDPWYYPGYHYGWYDPWYGYPPIHHHHHNNAFHRYTPRGYAMGGSAVNGRGASVHINRGAAFSSDSRNALVRTGSSKGGSSVRTTNRFSSSSGTTPTSVRTRPTGRPGVSAPQRTSGSVSGTISGSASGTRVRPVTRPTQNTSTGAVRGSSGVRGSSSSVRSRSSSAESSSGSTGYSRTPSYNRSSSSSDNSYSRSSYNHERSGSSYSGGSSSRSSGGSYSGGGASRSSGGSYSGGGSRSGGGGGRR